jgi:hypothetical protein
MTFTLDCVVCQNETPLATDTAVRLQVFQRHLIIGRRQGYGLLDSITRIWNCIFQSYDVL